MNWKPVGLFILLSFPLLLTGCGEAENTVIAPGDGYQRTPAEEARFQQGDKTPSETESSR